MIGNLPQYINLLVLAVVLAILAKLLVILKLGLRNKSKRITSLIFLNIYTPSRHALACINLQHALNCNKDCFTLSFKVIDKTNFKFDLKIKESLHINWRKPNLNVQQSLSSHPFTLAFVPLVFSVLFAFSLALLFHLLFSSSLTLIITIFCCLNYTLLLLHLIITDLVSYFSLSFIIFIISTLVISIFYFLNYTSVLLDLNLKLTTATDFIFSRDNDEARVMH